MNPTKPALQVWPWAIAAALAFVVLAYVVMIRISLRHPSAPVPGDAYAQAEHHDELLARRRAAQALGWRVDVVACPSGPAAERCEVVLEVRDAHGEPVLDLHGMVEARRADDASLDRTAAVEERGAGRYAADLPLARGGLYALDVTLEGPAGTWLGSREALLGSGAP